LTKDSHYPVKSKTTQGYGQTDIMLNVPYNAAAGSIVYLAITVRPNIAIIAGPLARFCENLDPSIGKRKKYF
jgi:hypothetical protein